LSKGDTSFSREGTINRSNGGSLDAQTTEKPVGTKKGRFQVSVDVPPKMDGSISPSGIENVGKKITLYIYLFLWLFLLNSYCKKQLGFLQF